VWVVLIVLALTAGWASAQVGGSIALTASPAQASAQPGQHATFTLTLGNSFVLDRTVDLAVTLSGNWTGNLTPATLTVPAGKNATATLDLLVPADAAPGTFSSFPVTASDATGTLATANVTVQVAAPPAPAPDPTPTPPALALSIPGATGQAGHTVTGTIVVRDLDDPTASPADLTFALGGPWKGGFPAGSFLRIYPGEAKQLDVNVTIPANAANGTQALPVSVTATTDGASFQLQATWNVTAVAAPPAAQSSASGGNAPITVSTQGPQPPSTPPAAPAPNLALAAQDLQDLTPGYASTESVLVQNTGNVALHVTLAANAADGSWTTTLDPAQMDLAAGASRLVKITIDTPTSVASTRDGSAKASLTATTTEGLSRYLPLDLRIPALVTSPVASPAPATPQTQAEAPPQANDRAVIGLAVGLGAIGAGAVALMHRPTREKLVWIGVGLYTRLARPDVLGHEERERLYKLVETQPGVHFHALQRELAWNTGTLTYHLRVLEKHGFIVDRRDGLFRRFYVQGVAPRKETFETTGPSGLRADVLEAVRGRQGLSQTDLALALGANKQTVNYHVKALERAGMIRLEKRGRETFLYPADAPASPPGHQAHA
jgi:DNA-binding MarR family transcriptional regulator